jgi:hypothetical protein
MRVMLASFGTQGSIGSHNSGTATTATKTQRHKDTKNCGEEMGTAEQRIFSCV